jgi:DNA-binding SARP family transcriptional activator
MGASETRTATRVQLCGRFVVRLAEERLESRFPGRQARLLFAHLAIRPHRAATRDELIEAIWAQELPSAPEIALSALLSKLRRLLGESAIEGRGEVRLALPEAWIDVECARESIHRAESLVASERWWDAYPAAVIARYISEREFLRGESAPWIDEVRRELEDVHLRAVECDARASLGAGGPEAKVAEKSARRLVELAPYRESGYCLLMRALELEGNNAEAVRLYEQLRARLRDDLGATPSPEVQEIHARLLG